MTRPTKWIRTPEDHEPSLANITRIARSLSDDELAEAARFAAEHLARGHKPCRCQGYNHECNTCHGTGYVGG